MERKGIILAGGSGTRLYPVTSAISKQLLPVFDKPMIYYPLSTLMLSGIQKILIISTPEDTPLFERLLGDGSQWGMELSYAVQTSPNGIAEALIIAEPFLAKSPSALILGDNIFYGHSFESQLTSVTKQQEGATIFSYHVNNPEQYGVAEFDARNRIIDIEEKPKNPKSNYAVTGVYFYDNTAVEHAKQIKPSPRGELEITDLNRKYLEQRNLSVELMGRGYAWLDTGTHENLLQASMFVHTIIERQGLQIGCLEEIAFELGFIDEKTLKISCEKYKKTDYGHYMEQLIS